MRTKSGIKKSNKRRNDILELISTEKCVYVDELAERFSVTQETIRRDLSKLADQHLLKKVHGGAVSGQLKYEMEFSDRAKIAEGEKKQIAHKAMELFKAGDTLFIDFGTTTLEFANELKKINGLTVITNSPLIAETLKTNGKIDVILIGGELSDTRSQCLGAVTLNNMGQFFADYAVIGAVAIHPDRGIMVVNVDEAAVARKMVEQSNKTIVLADGGKLGKHATHLVARLNQIDTLVTTTPENPLHQAKLAGKVKLIQADQVDAS